MIKKRCILIRSISIILISAFALQEMSYSAPMDQSVSYSQKPMDLLLQDPTRFETPLDFSTLKEIHKGQNGTLIIHIQDAHSNLSGQENLAKTLDEIMKKYNVSLILSEGGSQDCSLTPIKDIASPEVWKKIARKYLIEGKLSGEEYLNLTSDHPMKIMGLEDLSLYLKSVQDYADLARKREEVLNYLSLIQRAADKLKNKLYSKELLEVEKQNKTQGVESNFKTLFAIAKEKNIDLSEYSNLVQLIELTLKEKLINFDLANLEQVVLLEEIQKNGGEGDVKEQLLKLSQMKNQKLSQLAYLEKALSIANKKNIPLDRYPNLMQYEDYLKDFSNLDLEKILEELEKAEDKVYVSLLADKDARLVRSIDRYLGLLETAYHIQMSTKDFKTFEANEPDFSTVSYLAFLNRKLAELGYFEDLIPYKNLLEEGKKSLEGFYDSVEKRDYAFLQNTERILQEEKQKIAVLITGGYHTPHLKKLLEDKGYSTIVLTPLVTSETNQAKYEKRLLAPLGAETGKIRIVQGESKTDKSLSELEKDLKRQNKKRDGVRPLLVALNNDSNRVLSAENTATLKEVQNMLNFQEKEFRKFLLDVARTVTNDDGKAKVLADKAWAAMQGKNKLSWQATQDRLVPTELSGKVGARMADYGSSIWYNHEHAKSNIVKHTSKSVLIRYPSQYKFLRDYLSKRLTQNRNPLSIVSLGAADGREPASIAAYFLWLQDNDASDRTREDITVGRLLRGIDVKILAVDKNEASVSLMQEIFSIESHAQFRPDYEDPKAVDAVNHYLPDIRKKGWMRAEKLDLETQSRKIPWNEIEIVLSNEVLRYVYKGSLYQCLNNDLSPSAVILTSAMDLAEIVIASGGFDPDPIVEALKHPVVVGNFILNYSNNWGWILEKQPGVRIPEGARLALRQNNDLRDYLEQHRKDLVPAYDALAGLDSIGTQALRSAFEMNNTVFDLELPTLFKKIDLISELSQENFLGPQAVRSVIRKNLFGFSNFIKIVSKDPNLFKQAYLELSQEKFLGQQVLRSSFEKYSWGFAVPLMEVYGKRGLFNQLSQENSLGLQTLRSVFEQSSTAFAGALREISEDYGKFQNAFETLSQTAVGIARLRAYFKAAPFNFVFTLMLSRPDALKGFITTEGGFNLNAFLEKEKKVLVFKVYEVASLNAAQGMTDSFGLNPERVVVAYRDQVSLKMARDRFARYPGVRIRSDRVSISIDEIPIEFHDNDNVSDNLEKMPYRFFKYILSDPLSPDERKHMRTTMGLSPERKVWVVSSPSPDDINAILNIYSRQIGLSKPLLILGMRDENPGLKRLLTSLGYRVLVRNDSDQAAGEPFNGRAEGRPINEADIVILNTQGELRNLFAIANTSIVGYDRNIMEPASQGKGAFFCTWLSGSGSQDQDTRRFLSDNGAALPISNLSGTQDNEQRVLDQNAVIAMRHYKEVVIPTNRFFAGLLVAGLGSGARLSASKTPTHFEAGAKNNDLSLAKMYGARLADTVLKDIKKIKSLPKNSKEYQFFLKLVAEAIAHHAVEGVTALYLAEENALLRIEGTKNGDAHVFFYLNPEETAEAFNSITFGAGELEAARKTEIEPEAAQKIVQTILPLEEGVLREESQVDSLAWKAAGEIFANSKIIDNSIPVYHISNIDDRLWGIPLQYQAQYLNIFEARLKAFRQNYGKLGKGQMGNVSFGFFSSNENLSRRFKSDEIPSGSEVRYVYHGRADVKQAEINFVFHAVGIDKIPEKIGFTPITTAAVGSDEMVVLPTEGEMLYATLIARLNLSEENFELVKRSLDRFMKLLVDKLEGSKNLTKEDLDRLQQFYEGYNYLRLAVRAIEKLKIDQFIKYTRLAMEAIGTAA